MRTHHLYPKIFASAVLAGALLSQGAWTPARAGCGCEKAPPVAASIRPSVTYAGMEVDLFHPSLGLGEAYDVRFTGTDGATVSVAGTGWERRDLADGVVKPHVTVAVPPLPLGPASVEVYDLDSNLVMAVSSDGFTVAPQPIVMTETFGSNRFPGYQAAVGADGAVYVSIDLTAVRDGRSMDIWARSYPLRFVTDDVAFYNVQGFLMQLLDEPMAGLLAYDSREGSPSDSTVLRYFRHEFETYFAAHEERDTHAVDPSDDDWHLDGTPHIDHNHLIVALYGVLADGSLPVPGATPPFELVLSALPEEVLDGSSTSVDASSTGVESFSTRSGEFEATSVKTADADVSPHGKKSPTRGKKTR